MTPTRRTCALAALALTLVLGACSAAPKNAVAPTLEPQFGTDEADFGVNVALAPSKSAYVLSEQTGYMYDEYGYVDGNSDSAMLSRYGADGRLMWSRVVVKGYCSYWDDCTPNPLDASALGADAKGYSYALVTDMGIYGDCANVYSHHVYKYDAAGRTIKSIDIGSGGKPFGGAMGAAPTEAVNLTVDASGNF